MTTQHRAMDCLGERPAPPLCVDDFLSMQVCSAIRQELRFAFWQPSTVAYRNSSEALADREAAMRVSESTDERWFTRELLKVIRVIDKKIEARFPGFHVRRELWQATRYRSGGHFSYHLDAGSWRQDRAGDRERTVLIYLNRPRGGGATCFKNLKIKVAPRVGRMVAWNNLTAGANPDPASLHAGLPVLGGEKFVLITWMRQRQYKRERLL
jgi:prolyl 4-hydroxylase